MTARSRFYGSDRIRNLAAKPIPIKRVKKQDIRMDVLLFLVTATDLIVHIREHLPILLGTRVTAFREPQSRKAAR